MPNYRALAGQAARQAGVPVNVFLGLVRQESGFNPNALSPAGAHGLTQLMPGTASGLARRYGINTNTPYGNLLGGALYLKEQLQRFGNVRSALAAYNAGPGAVERYGGVPPYAETQRYVSSILRGSGGGGGVSGPTTAPSSVPSGGGANTPGLPTLDALGMALTQNLSDIGRYGHISPSMINQNLFGAMMYYPSSTSSSGSPGPLTGFSPSGGHVTIAPGANRRGVPLNPDVTAFVREVSAVDGKPLVIGTGSNHNRFVVGTNRQSAHWTGRAADIPASGADLTRLGRSALVAAGMSPQQAAREHGGLYNIGGYQIIFNSNIGGDHYNHLHVGLRG